MFSRTLADSPRHERGDGQVSYLLLNEAQFGSKNLTITWVEAAPNSQQRLHQHPESEQAYVIVRGRGQMIVGDEVSAVDAGTLVFIPPGTTHAIRNDGPETLVYVSATSPPLRAVVQGGTWRPAYADDP